MHQYQLVKMVGNGGFADVYRAIRSDTRAVVAVKVLRDFNNHEARHRFAREVRQLLGLRHRRVIAILDYNLNAKRPWYAMPLMKGGTLSRWAGKIPSETMRGIVREMAEVLAYLHEQGALHRDIKPDNLLVDAAGEVTVGDFGLGNHPRYTLIFTQHAAGTPGYAAPELRAPCGIASAASDVYSLGATVFHLLTGIHPARAKNFDPWVAKRRIPPDLRSLVLLMMRGEPCQRPTASTILAMLGGRNPAGYTPLQSPRVLTADDWKALLAVGGSLTLLSLLVGVAVAASS